MSATENRIVRMQFDNAQFKKAASETKQDLADIDKAVANAGKGKGLLDIAGNMDTVKVHASAMQVAVVTALSTIVSKAVDVGLKIAKSLTLDPLKQGFDEYELKMKSIQTILANTKGESLKTVSAALQELNKYSDKTIYNFANMTENIGKMTTAGISLKDATATVKGFSNMAALAGGDANAAAGAMEQFSQGLQAGSIKAMDWMSLSNRGLGSQSLQKAFYETAKAAGTLTDLPVGQTFDEWVKASGGFRGSLESGWLTTNVATDALKIMTGDVKDVQTLMKQGFDRKTAEDMLTIAQNALDSATKVRTFSAFMGTLKEQVGSGFAQVFEVLIGDFNEATDLFTKFSNFTGKVIGKIFNYITNLLTAWDAMGGRLAILHTFRNILAPIGAILGVIADAWKKAFPTKEGGSTLATLSQLLQKFTRPLNILAKLITGEITPLQAFFRILGVGRRIIAQLGDLFGPFVSRILELMHIPKPNMNEGFLGFLKSVFDEIGRVIKQVQKLIGKGKSLKEALSKVKFHIPDMPDMPGLPSLPSFAGGSAIGGKFAAVSSAYKSLSGQISSSSDDISSSFASTEDDASSFGDKVASVFSHIKDAIQTFKEGGGFEDILASLNLAVLATFVIQLSKMFDAFSKVGKGFAGLMSDIGGALGAFQNQARAKLITSIAIAIGILALSLWLLSRIPAGKLAIALITLAGVAAIMKTAMEAFTSTIGMMEGKGMNLKMLVLGASMILFAIAISILASAMKKLNDVEWQSVLYAAGAMYGLVKAMQAIAAMPNKGILRSAFALVVVSGALWLFAVAVKKFAQLDLKTFAEGITYAALSLSVLTTFMKGFTSSLGGAAALVVTVGALWLLIKVIQAFAKLDWGTFWKGLSMVSLSLLSLVFTLYMFEASLAGAAALVVAVGALWLMVDVIEAFAKLDWGTFGKGLAMFSITMVVLGTIMALMGVFSPLILLGAAAILLFGAAIFLLGTGILALQKGLAGLILISGGVVAAITAFAVGAAMGFAIFLQTLALQAPIMKDSFLRILQALIDTIVGAVPMIIDGIKRLWNAVKKEIGGNDKKKSMKDSGKSWIQNLGEGILGMMPQIVQKGVEILVAFLQGIANNADKIGAVAIELIVNLINALGHGIPKLLTAGIKLISDFLHGLADAIRGEDGSISGGLSDIKDALMEVGKDIIDGLIEGIKSKLGEAVDAIKELAGNMIDAAKDKLKVWSPSRIFMDIGKFLVMGLTKGVQDNASAAIVAVGSLVSGQIALATEYVNKFIQDLDQKALEATGRAQGLQRAAEAAAKAAEKTKKNKKDDKAANQLQKEADKATKKAERLERKADRAKAKEERAQQFQDATLIEKAQMRSEDAQNQMDAAKAAEMQAESKRAEAAALREQAKAAGVSDKDAKAMRARAAELEKQAQQQAERANDLIAMARKSALAAMTLQKRAGQEAADAFQAQFDDAAKADAEAQAFEKLNDTEKAAKRREQAAMLQAKADADLAKAKKLAYTDLEAANDLAQQAMDEADAARQALVDAAQFDQSAAQGVGQSQQETGGTVVNLDSTEAASIAFDNYSSIYDMATAAAAAAGKVEFNQYNTSPEALNDIEIYRLTSNQLTHAADKLTPTAA